MSIFDILGGGGLGGILNSLGGQLGSGQNPFGGSSSQGGGLGGSIGNVLNSLGGQVRSAQNTFNDNITSKGGLGSMLGAGALGALLGNMAGGSLLKNAALLGAGAVALNFYKKWAQGKQEQQSGHVDNPAISQQQQSANASSELPRLDQPTMELISRSMIYAAKSDGHIDDKERDCMETILANMIPGVNADALIRKIEVEPVDPGKIASQVRSPEQGEDVYRLSCSVIDIDQFMERNYLDALAKSLGIGEAEKSGIEAEASELRQQIMAAAK